jgi:hypothetical protein
MYLRRSLLILSLLIISCSEPNEKQFTGRLIELDFNNVEEIPPNSWIKFDDYTFEHVELMEDGDKIEYALPMHYVVIDTLNEKRDFVAPLSVKNIGLHIGRNLRKVNQLPDRTGANYIIDQPQTLAAIGTLKVMKTDSSRFSITVPKNYTIGIKVLKK